MAFDDLFLKTPVPLPKSGFAVPPGADGAEACRRLDALFDDIIRVYPDLTRRVLSLMYYGDENVDYQSGLLEKGYQANWYAVEMEGGIVPVMAADERLKNCPVLLRIGKLHEIGVHIGQAYCRLTANRSEFLKEYAAGAFDSFTEMCAAMIDKLVTDALPEDILRADVKAIGDATLEEKTLASFKSTRETSYEDYARLKHRPDRPSAEDYSRLHGRDEVKTFDEKMNSGLPSRSPFRAKTGGHNRD